MTHEVQHEVGSVGDLDLGRRPHVDLSDVVAVVLTHQRPRLATALVRTLVQDEGLAPDQVIVVVDVLGGLDDARLEAAVRVIRLEEPAGPAAGFRAGLDAAFADPSVQFAYLCEDDVGLVGMPVPRLAEVRDAVREQKARVAGNVGAVVAYGRIFGDRAGVTVPYVPDAQGARLQPVDVAAWGATLVCRQAHDAGVRPDDFWFFAYEDFDYFLQMRDAGFAVMVHRDTGLATAEATATNQGRDATFEGQRPDDDEEWWRAYYVARNQVELARRHGSPRWLVWHLLYRMRRLQRARGRAERAALLAGLRDGVRGRSGRNAKYVRRVGERPDSRPARRSTNTERSTDAH